jgi:hypothetical protein
LTLYRNLVEEFGKHLEWTRRQGLEAGERRDQQLCIGLLASSVYNSAKAVMALYEGGFGEASLIFVRSQFEQAAKAEYFSSRPGRVRDFLDSEPFERYKLTQGYDVKESLRTQIVADCKEAVKRNPHLLRHQSKAGKGMPRADFLAIREALKPPDIQDLLRANKWDFDLYVTIFLFGSLWIHGSINELRKYVDEYPDGSVGFAPEQELRGPPDYLMQSANYVLGFIGRLSKWFPGLDRDAEVRALYERHQNLWGEMKDKP